MRRSKPNFPLSPLPKKFWKGEEAENGMSQVVFPVTSHFQMILHPNADRSKKKPDW